MAVSLYAKTKRLIIFHSDAHDIMWERAPLQNLARDGQLHAYKHNGFWHPMDMLKDKEDLNKLWATEKAPWDVWHHFEKKAY